MKVGVQLCDFAGQPCLVELLDQFPNLRLLPAFSHSPLLAIPAKINQFAVS